MPQIQEQDYPRCQHIHLKGVRCGSPALRGHEHCYFHNRVRKVHRGVAIPLLEEPAAIQVSVTEILRALAARDLDHRTANLMLYGLQVAAQNLPRMTRPLAHNVVLEDPADQRFAAAAQALGPKATSAQIIQAAEATSGHVETLFPTLSELAEEAEVQEKKQKEMNTGSLDSPARRAG